MAGYLLPSAGSHGGLKAGSSFWPSRIEVNPPVLALHLLSRAIGPRGVNAKPEHLLAYPRNKAWPLHDGGAKEVLFVVRSKVLLCWVCDSKGQHDEGSPVLFSIRLHPFDDGTLMTAQRLLSLVFRGDLSDGVRRQFLLVDHGGEDKLPEE